MGSYTVLLGRKPLDLAPPVVLQCDIQCEHVEYDPRFFYPSYDGPLIEKDIVTANRLQVFSGSRLVAVSGRYTLTKDVETGHTTLRLFKNETRLIS
jgi:hypothetical protein